jgi:protein SCO1
MIRIRNYGAGIAMAVLLSSVWEGCAPARKEQPLPIMGRREVVRTVVEGVERVDTVYHTIPDYSFVNQDSAVVTPQTFEGKIYVSDFFFTSCPTICPIMKTQMLRVYEHIAEMPDVLILSHSIDPEYDTVALLYDFAERLGMSSAKWHFVTGEKEKIFEVGQKGYMVTAQEDSSEPGGYLHSGAFVLVDKQRRVRGFYDGTKEDQVDRLIRDIDKLRREYEK